MSFFCKSPFRVDHQVAATDQVESGERRVADQVMLGKNQQVADAFVDTVAPLFSGSVDEEARQPLRRQVAGNAGWIESGAASG
jgi:hypothetical protein